MSEEYWELVEYECIDGKCLMIHNIPHDSKLGALSLDHRSIGEAIVKELNNLEFDRNAFYISEAKRMRLLAFIEDKGLINEFYKWEKEICER